MNGTDASMMDPAIAISQAEAYAYHQDYVAKNPELYQKPTLERILAGSKIATPAYIQSRRQMEQLRHSVSRGFDGVDLLITPTTPVTSMPDTMQRLNASDRTRIRSPRGRHAISSEQM
jgi:Asp-tRNA(Asn)/Glu-tRNA(Gln) amidotransferase A subunit family amidase